MPKKTNNMNLKEFRSIEDMQQTAFLLPREVGHLLRIGENSLYKLLSSDDCPFPVMRLTSQTIRIPTKQFFNWYNSAFNLERQQNIMANTRMPAKQVEQPAEETMDCPVR